jgi:protein O-mannosyl-transferase
MLNKTNSTSPKQPLIVYIFLILATIAVFWQVHQYSFVNIDDNTYVSENSFIQHGISTDRIRWAFSTTYAEFWHPLTWLSLMADYQIHGLNPGGYHLTNLILHILSTLLLFWLFNRRTGAVWKSAFVAAFFALHPLHVESVAWIAERKDVLSAFFWMLTLCLYVYYTEKPVIQRYWLVIFSFICALMSKPMVVTLPVIMILLDYWPLNRFESKKDNLILWQVKEKLPFFVLSAVFSIITIYAQHKPTAKYFYFPLSARLANAPVAFTAYLEKTFWPHNLAVFYPISDQLPAWQVLGTAMLLIFVSVAVIVMIKSRPYLFIGWSWYVITLLPVIGIIRVGDFAMADRYTYLSLIGTGIMLGWGIPHVFPNINIRKNILLPIGIIFIAILAFMTNKQCGYWKNSTILFNHALQVTKDNYLAYNNLGNALLDEGKYEEAVDRYNNALRIIPSYVLSYNNRGNAYTKLGQYQLAMNDCNEAIRLNPDDFLGYFNRGNVYKKIGQYQHALEDYNKAIRLNPDNSTIYFNRGNTYISLGQYQTAIEDFNKVILLNPASFDTYNNRAFIYVKLGQYQQALEDYSQAILLKPDYSDAYSNRAFLYFRQGDNVSGCRDAQTVCNLGNCNTLESAKGKGLCH